MQLSWVSHCAKISPGEISLKSKKQTSKMQGKVSEELNWVGANSVQISRGCFKSVSFILFQFCLKNDRAALMSAGFLQPSLTNWAFQQLFAH